MNRVKDLRLSKGWLQIDLAKKLNIGKNTVSRYETEQRQLDPETIHKLCDLFNVSADYLLCRSDLPGLDLAPDEQELVRRWRGLSAESRAFMLQTLMMLELSQEQKNNAVPDVETAE